MINIRMCFDKWWDKILLCSIILLIVVSGFYIDKSHDKQSFNKGYQEGLKFSSGIQYSYERCMKYGTQFYYPDTYYCKLFAGKIKARDE